MQANFVGEQAAAWAAARAEDDIVILAPHDAGAARSERAGRVEIRRFRYVLPERAQKLAYPAILPNVQRNPALLAQVPLFLLAEYWAASKLSKRLKPDLVYAHWIMPQGITAWQLKQKLGIRYVLQNHSSDLAVFLKFGALGKALARRVLFDAAHVFCVNAAQRNFALELFRGVAREEFAARCSVLPMGIAELPGLGPAPEDAGFDIASIGRLSRKKGLNYLIAAAESLAAVNLRPKIGIAGDGEERANLEAQVQSADVNFVGFLVGKAKREFLEGAKSFAFPAVAAAEDVEGLPVALLEALARGRPVLAGRDTNIELLPEWPQLQDAVVLVKDPSDVDSLAEGLKTLIQLDPQHARSAARVVARYEWGSLIEEYLATVDRALRAS